MGHPVENLLARNIKVALAKLSKQDLKITYIQEACYLLEEWPFYDNEHISEGVVWAIAQDFAIKFPRHSYAEWAFVFGIPKDHAVIREHLVSNHVAMRRRAYLYKNRAVFIVACCLISMGCSIIESNPTVAAILVATGFVAFLRGTK